MRDFRKFGMALSWLKQTVCLTFVKHKSRLLIAPILTCGFISIAAAQTASGPIIVNNPAEALIVSPGGVDMRTGRYVFNETDLRIGPPDRGGIELKRVMNPVIAEHIEPFGNMSHNWDFTILEKRGSVVEAVWGVGGNDYRMIVNFNGLSETFESKLSENFFKQVSRNSFASLSFSSDRASSSTVYTFTSESGTVITFRAIGSGDCAVTLRCAYASEIIRPDGVKFNLDYEYSSGATGNKARLRKIVSSQGYVLFLEGANGVVTRACTFNLAAQVLPANFICPAGAAAASAYGYASGRLTSVTMADGGIKTYNYLDISSKTEMKFFKSGQNTPWLTNLTYKSINGEEVLDDVVEKQIFSDGQEFTYIYYKSPDSVNKPSSIAGGKYTNILGKQVNVIYSFPILPGTGPGDPCSPSPCTNRRENIVYQQTSGPIIVTDQIGQSTLMDYCDPAALAGLVGYTNKCIVTLLQSYTSPEGNKTILLPDSRRNIHQITRKSKTGTLYTDIITSATYSCISLPKSCAKPITQTDARGFVTTSTYDAMHGGILSETGPSVEGVAPQKRLEYAQRSAWILDGSGTAFIKAPTAIWLLVKERYCRTSSASQGQCVGGASDEVVTDYDYGPDGGPNNLLLRGLVVSADGSSLRTCYNYDLQGRVISETTPNANLGSCP